MDLRRRRGSVLVHVLMTGVVVGIVAAGILRLAMLRYLAATRATTGAQNRKQAEGLLNRAITSWNSTGVCSTIIGSPNVACTGSAGTCSCTCPSAGYPRVVAAVDGSGRCALTIESQDPMP